MAWQATAISVVGAIVGVPLGIVVGNAAWHLFANNLGVVPVTVVLAGLTAGIAAGVFVLANLLAIDPAVISSRLSPSQLLRSR